MYYNDIEKVTIFMEGFEFNPLQTKIIAPEQAMEGHLKLAEKDGSERDAVARVLALGELIEAKTAARWSVSARQPVVTRSTLDAAKTMGTLRKKVA